jgi:hypothetical protein
MLSQLKQSLSAPTWEPEDWHWRPHFLPPSRLPTLSPLLTKPIGRTLQSDSPVPGSDGPERGPSVSSRPSDNPAAERNGNPAPGSIPNGDITSPLHDDIGPSAAGVAPPPAFLVHLINSQAELEMPRRALAALQDSNRLAAYQQAIESALKNHPGEDENGFSRGRK